VEKKLKSCSIFYHTYLYIFGAIKGFEEMGRNFFHLMWKRFFLFPLGLNNVMGLAVDWIGNNLYWTDEGLRAIFVTSLSDSSKMTR